MRIRFHGGVDEVGRLGMFVEEDNFRLLFDYGLSATDPPKYPVEVPPVDMLLLSHAHLDHSGMVPWVVGRYESPILTTLMTQRVSEVLFEDNVKVSEMEGYPQMYGKQEIKAAKHAFEKIKFGENRKIGPFDIKVHYAGHIPGAAMFEISGKQTTLFTGDINTLNTHLLLGTKPVKCDNLVMEGTYAGRNHPKRLKLEYEFLKKIDEIVARGGKVVVPAFAIGRTQEVMLILRNSKHQIYVDGMGNSITELYLNKPDFIRSAKELRKIKNRVKMVRSFRGRKYAMKGDVIITTSGMLDGGPVLSYIQNLKDSSKNAILLTGYQVEGTNGRLLLDENKIRIQGVVQKINCEVDFFDFSAHSGHKELVEFIHGCEPKKVILCHSDNREAIAEELKGSYDFCLPKLMEEIEL